MSRNLFGFILVACAAVVFVTTTAQSSEPKSGGGKIVINKLDDLPQHAYPVTGSVVELFQSKERILKLAEKVQANIEADMKAYEVDDETTLQNWHQTLLSVAMLQKNYDRAERELKIIRSLEKKEALKLTAGLLTETEIRAARKSRDHADRETYQKIYKELLAKRINELPWGIVQDEIENTRAMTEIYSENLILGLIQERFQNVVQETGELPADMAGQLIGFHNLVFSRLKHKQVIVDVCTDYIEKHATAKKPDIWAARSVTLSKTQKLSPVLVAVWDSGVDPKIFADALWNNENEQTNGRDDDGNGFVDDVHGIAYDYHARRTTGELCPLHDSASRMPEIMNHLKGFSDIQAAIKSEEANNLIGVLGALKPDQVKGFIEDLSLASNYTHGTHVAGIMVEGNPFARIMVARHTYDHHMIPVARTLDWGERDAAKCRDMVTYFKQAGVRVVNMSWGESQQDAQDSFESNGIGDNAEERRELARKVFTLQKEALFKAIKNAPEILFVCAAGNSDNDVEFDEYIPSSFDLPNLLVVGAVDQAGDPTSFTSFGSTVEVYANGFEVDSYVPGGRRMKMSGTSMASPGVANLAAKILAHNPKLTPEQAIKLIIKSADRKTSGDYSYLLINPKRTIDRMVSHRPSD